MSLLDNFIKNYDKDEYKRYPKAKRVVNIVYFILGILLVAVSLRAIMYFVGLD